MIKLPSYYWSTVVGLLLSDGWLAFPSSHSKNARLGFEQSGINAKYVWSVFFILSHYCSSGPMIRTRSRGGIDNTGILFVTRALPCFTGLYNLFYVNGIKVIPENIYELLTPVALAHMIQGDGAKHGSGLLICTDSFSIQDAVRLTNVLIIKYRLDCTVRFPNKIRPRVYIRGSSMSVLRSIVTKHMNPSMLYKLD